MWIISVLPDIAIHAIFAVGVLGLIAGFVLGFIPGIKAYKLPIQIISILVFSLGLYLEGGLADNLVWQLRVKEMEAKVSKAEAESAKVNTKIVEKIVTKNQVIREKGKTVTEYVDREVVKYDTKYLPGEICEIPKEVIKAHNAAASGNAIVDADTRIPTDAINKAARLPEKK